MKDDPPARYMDDGSFSVAASPSTKQSANLPGDMPDVLALCTVKADLRDVPESKYTKARSRPGGEFYFVAEFRIEILVDNSKLKFFLIFDGEEYGSVEPIFDG